MTAILIFTEWNETESEPTDGPSTSYTNQSSQPGFGFGSQSFSSSQNSYFQDSQKTPPKKTPEPLPPWTMRYLSKGTSENSMALAFMVWCNEVKKQDVTNAINLQITPELYFIAEMSPDVNGSINIILAFSSDRKTRVTKLNNILDKVFTTNWHKFKVLLPNKFQEFAKVAKSHACVYESNMEHDDDQSVFLHKQLYTWAFERNHTDAHTILGKYMDYAQPLETCKYCQDEARDYGMQANNEYKEHTNDHKAQHKNALVFSELVNMKLYAQHAADVAFSVRRNRMESMTRQERFIMYFNQAIRELTKYVIRQQHTGSLQPIVNAIALMRTMIPAHIIKYDTTPARKPSKHPLNVSELFNIIHRVISLAMPKQRVLMFRGNINTGKSTLAIAIIETFQGVLLNMNTPMDKIPYEIGRALDKFVVLFEDVKGIPRDPESGLPEGYGIMNLDNMREGLDGSKVGLERKHANKVAQHFPPSLITMNNYRVPQTLMARVSFEVIFSRVLDDFEESVQEGNIDLHFLRSPHCFVGMCCLYARETVETNLNNESTDGLITELYTRLQSVL